jgi:hypothetical protein
LHLDYVETPSILLIIIWSEPGLTEIRLMTL